MSSLLEENSSLQQKLHSQEEDFNLQNRTLMEEISRVCNDVHVVEYIQAICTVHGTYVYVFTYMHMYVSVSPFTNASCYGYFEPGLYSTQL